MRLKSLPSNVSSFSIMLSTETTRGCFKTVTGRSLFTQGYLMFETLSGMILWVPKFGSSTISLVWDHEPYLIFRRNASKCFSTLACLLRCLASTEVRTISVRWNFKWIKYGCSYGIDDV